MATIELDIIRQRSEKLMPSEKIELIRYLLASLPADQKGLTPDLVEFAKGEPSENSDASAS